MRFPLQIIQCPFRKKETVAVVVHKISELVLCKDRIFTNITPQVFTLTQSSFGSTLQHYLEPLPTAESS
jgi:hypothetical protein